MNLEDRLLLGVVALILAFVAGLFIGGCSPLPMRPTPARQDQAVSVVWVDQYMMVIPPPEVVWVEGASLNCLDGRGWFEKMSLGVVECVAGTFWYDRWLAYVAWPDDTTSYATTALAHELCHARGDIEVGGPADYNHTGPCFTPGGYVELANDALVRAGL